MKLCGRKLLVMKRNGSVLQAQYELKNSLKQAYQEAPWRKQVQVATSFLTGLISLALLAWVYLSLSSQAVTAGLETRNIFAKNKQIRQLNSDLESHLARLTSSTEMKLRLSKMDFQRVNAQDLVYLMVSGYYESNVRLGTPSSTLGLIRPKDEGPLMSPEYNQSWIDWMFEYLKQYEPLYRVGGEK